MCILLPKSATLTYPIIKIGRFSRVSSPLLVLYLWGPNQGCICRFQVNLVPTSSDSCFRGPTSATFALVETDVHYLKNYGLRHQLFVLLHSGENFGAFYFLNPENKYHSTMKGTSRSVWCVFSAKG